MSAGRVVVGLSTIPSRIALLPPTIRSLREQTRVPDEILLAVPRVSEREKCEYRIPDELSSLEAEGLLRIVRTDNDYGPGTKLLGCVSELEDADTFIAADDDLLYRSFFVDELASEVQRSRGAASFYVYESRGLRVGQGSDGFAMTGALAKKCTEIIPLLDRHPELKRHDDFWISFILRKHGVAPRSLAHRCARHGVELAYENRELGNGLIDQEADGRLWLNRRCHGILFRYARPTPSMWLTLPAGLFRGALRHLERKTRSALRAGAQLGESRGRVDGAGAVQRSAQRADEVSRRGAPLD